MEYDGAMIGKEDDSEDETKFFGCMEMTCAWCDNKIGCLAFDGKQYSQNIGIVNAIHESHALPICMKCAKRVMRKAKPDYKIIER